MKYFHKTILYLYKALNFEKNENLNQLFLYEFSNNINNKNLEGMVNSEVSHFFYLNTNEIYKKRRQQREKTFLGIILNAFYSLFPSILTMTHSSSVDLSDIMTINTLYSIEILTNLLFYSGNCTTTTATTSNQSNRYLEIYINIILSHLILFEMKINQLIINENSSLLFKKYQRNYKIIKKINLLNNYKSNKNIVKIKNILNFQINKIIVNFVDVIKVNNMTKECQVRIDEIIQEKKKNLNIIDRD